VVAPTSPASPLRPPPRAETTPSPLLERAFLFTFVCHGAGMLAMPLVLARMLPGGGPLADAERVAAIAEHPWLFRLGWLPWHLTALSDALLAVAFLREKRVPRGWAWLSALLTAAAFLPDQGGQALWVTRGVKLAQAAARTGDPGPYLAFEAWAFPMTAAYAAFLYTLAAACWSMGLARAGLWTSLLTRLSWPLWLLFAGVSLGPLLPEAARPPASAVAAGNALAFVGLMLWTALAGEQVMRASRPDTDHGRWAPWRAPWGGPWGNLLELLANSRFLRGLCSWLPTPSFSSDIRDVIYVNYLVPTERLRPYVPEGLEIQQVGPGYAMFSILTYQHGHFGPGMLGPLRALFPSPVQSNWRTYVRDPRTGKEGIYFTTNAVTTSLHALGARLMADGAPMHRAASASLVHGPDGHVALDLTPGQGSAPDLSLDLRPTADRALRGPWAECFADYDAMLAYTVPQDRAMATQPWQRTTSRDEIFLGIPLTDCEPLDGEVTSAAVARVVGDAPPLCFRVPRVAFRLEGELYDRWLTAAERRPGLQRDATISSTPPRASRKTQERQRSRVPDIGSGGSQLQPEQPMVVLLRLSWPSLAQGGGRGPPPRQRRASGYKISTRAACISS